MPPTRKQLALTVTAVLLLALSVAQFVHARRHAPAALQEKPAVAGEDRETLLKTGKKIFIERCAKCHDERGDKPLKTGPPLNQRDLSDEEITRLASGRLKNAPDEDKRAVALYIISFMKRK